MHYYNLVSAPFLRKRLKLTDMAIILVYELIRILSLKSANFPHNLQMKAIFPHMSFVRKSQLVSMLFLKKVHSKASEIKPVEPQTLIERIPIINYFEMPHFENYLLALSFSDTTGNIKKYRDRLISNLQCVRSVLCYDVEIPQDYNEDSFLAISKLLGSY